MGDPQRSDPAGRRASGARRRGGGMSAGDGAGFAIDPGKVRAWKRYPAYKDSGVEWLGEVPAGWELVRLKYAVRMITERTTDQNSNSSYIGLENIESWTGRLIGSEDSLDPEGQSGSFESGDVLFGKLRPYLAKVHKATVDGICSTEILVLRPKLVSQDYLFYYLLNSEFIKTVNSSTYGTKMPRANWIFIGNLLIPDISLHDQSAIAAFLDRETPRIDALIAKKQRFIELLEEKRQAIISHAVTKGLDPGVEMKDSGVEWIGEVPAGWEVIRLKNTICSPLQYGASESGEIYDPELPRYVRITDISEEGTLKEDTKKSIPIDIAGPYLLSYGDILFARSGATVGKTFLYLDSWGLAAYAGYLIRARVNQTILDPRYIGYFCRSSHYWDWISSAFIQATIQNISADKYANLMIPLPPIAEQRFIINYLNCETDKVKGLIRTIHDQVGKLREYRTALISAAVTGKIDVRGEAPAAP